MNCCLLFLVVVGAFAAPVPKPSTRLEGGTGWRGKLSKFLPGPLGRRLAFNAATGYDAANEKCLMTNKACPAKAKSKCPTASPTALCTSDRGSPEEGFGPSDRGAIYTWAVAEAANRAAETVFDIAAGTAWNQWAQAKGAENGCGSSSCANIYKKAILVYDEANCWPKSMAVPIIVNERGATNNEQLQTCAKTVKHLLGKKPLGAFLVSPVEQLERVVDQKVLFTCGNTKKKSGVKDMSVPQYPYLAGEGGGGTAGNPAAYAEQTGMCGTWNSDLVANWKSGGTRFGGTVMTEEYGHTIFDVAISQYDPEGWKAVQMSEAQANKRFIANNAVGHERDPDWDCHTAATEYYAAGVDLILYNVRIGTNHKATTRSELKAQDPTLWCLALRHYELNNKFTPCPSGPARTDVTQDVDCKKTLKALGVTIFGPDGSNGAKGGGAKTDSSLIVSSTAFCQAPGAICTAYKAYKFTGTTTAAAAATKAAAAAATTAQSISSGAVLKTSVPSLVGYAFVASLVLGVLVPIAK